MHSMNFSSDDEPSPNKSNSSSDDEQDLIYSRCGGGIGIKSGNNNIIEDYLYRLINDTYKEVGRIKSKRRTKVLKEALLKSRDLVLQKAKQQQHQEKKYDENDQSLRCLSGIGRIYPRLPSIQEDSPQNTFIRAVESNDCKEENKKQVNNGQESKLSTMAEEKKQKSPPTFQVEFCESKNFKKRTRVKHYHPICLESPTTILGPTRPLSTATIFLKSQYAVKDMTDLVHVPYFDDDGNGEDVISEFYDTRQREKLLEYGPLYLEKEMDDTIDETLSILLDQQQQFFDYDYNDGSCNNNDDTREQQFTKRSRSTQYYKSRKQHQVNKKRQRQQNDCHYKKIILMLKKKEGGIEFNEKELRRYFAKRLQHHLAKVMNLPIERIMKRFNVLTRIKQANPNDDFEKYLQYDNLHDSEEQIITGIDHNDPNTSSSSSSSSAAVATAADVVVQKRSVNNSETVYGMQHEKGRMNDGTKVSYSKHAMDSYRNLFCRRCFTYDCNNHGNLIQPNIELQMELAVGKERNGDWIDTDIIDGSIGGQAHQTPEEDLINREALENHSDSKDGPSTASKKKERVENDYPPRKEEAIKLDSLQRVIAEHVFQIFQGDTEKIAATIQCNVDSLQAYVNECNIKIKDPVFIKDKITPQESSQKKKRKVSDEKSMKCYNQCWLKRVQDTELHPSFDPCDHDEPCSYETCSCVQNAFFCTKHCVWGKKSRNFFRGCSCKHGQCRTMSCSCFAAKRECDPDLCHNCGASSDPPNQIPQKQRCRNDNIGMRRHCHLLLAESGIPDAGWGIYTKHALKKGDFVHEYVGEIISQEEAERRGKVYDKENRSYLFNLTSESVIDARKKGNKTKFANHSSAPNCYSKVISVNGDGRIGLFAKEEIRAQSELFFDYRYDVSMSHELLVKPSLTVDWMKKKKRKTAKKKST